MSDEKSLSRSLQEMANLLAEVERVCEYKGIEEVEKRYGKEIMLAYMNYMKKFKEAGYYSPYG